MRPFLKLIRWNNILIVALCQIISAISFVYNWPISEILNNTNFYLIVLSTTLITASGYIINDYLDVSIDEINKPKKVIIGKSISRKTAIKWHIGLNSLALLLAIKVNVYVAIIEIISIILLVRYSSKYKKTLLIGNLIISVLCGLSIFIWAFWLPIVSIKLLMVYSTFAIWSTLIRELIKDIEDIKGDRLNQCKTFPIVMGISKTKYLLYILIISLIVSSHLFFFYSGYQKTFGVSFYIFIFLIEIAVELPLFYLILKLYQSSSVADYGNASLIIKLTMISGILSMLFFRIIYYI